MMHVVDTMSTSRGYHNACGEQVDKNLSISIENPDVLNIPQFWVEKNNSGHKNSFFFKLNLFSWGKEPNLMTCSLPLREIL